MATSTPGPADQPQECIRLGRAKGQAIPSYHAAFSPDSATLAATDFGLMVIYDLATRREVRTLEIADDSDVTSAFSPDGRWLAAIGLNTTP